MNDFNIPFLSAADGGILSAAYRNNSKLNGGILGAAVGITEVNKDCPIIEHEVATRNEVTSVLLEDRKKLAKKCIEYNIKSVADGTLQFNIGMAYNFECSIIDKTLFSAEDSLKFRNEMSLAVKKAIFSFIERKKVKSLDFSGVDKNSVGLGNFLIEHNDEYSKWRDSINAIIEYNEYVQLLIANHKEYIPLNEEEKNIIHLWAKQAYGQKIRHISIVLKLNTSSIAAFYENGEIIKLSKLFLENFGTQEELDSHKSLS